MADELKSRLARMFTEFHNENVNSIDEFNPETSDTVQDAYDDIKPLIELALLDKLEKEKKMYMTTSPPLSKYEAESAVPISVFNNKRKEYEK